MTTYAFDPEIAAVVPLLPDLPGGDPLAIRAALSDMIAQFPPPDTTGVQIEDREIPGRDGDPAVPIRIYRPEQRSAPAALYSVHGGGFIAGDLETEHAFNVVLARELGVVVGSVDYRLAPETPFPGGLEDVYAGLVWMAAHADELAIDPQRIAIQGTSAGGGLSAALALLARDRGGPHIAFQYLSVPELDDRLTTASMTDFTDTPMWSRPRAIISWDSYLGTGRAGADDVSIYAAPSRATDLAGLPPAYVSVMHFDPLRDEGVAYSLGLLAAGVSVELHLFPGTFHGSMLIQDAAISKREGAEKLAVLRQALAL
ncbi:alpha/beta hydrolase [Mycobacterium montefiorense]|uniref:Esterase n=1 Tax=Mycobacterium montefiorense TaxID=154654 RepID=A0AA37PNS6_9MYCO|nr:alpha/beta hydrolase [Mycobacterium montefiorense]GBG37683.1 esterase [Mycobacterium montefiorense]GKU34820.1 esterase [Mycobacterium montefiorense]GKU40834.1 esterase [Mycobacterium montefiorense]GKU46941.1 esterase [Mycobacterium montefiorense]GKU49061.1 esterase [Mycobacterium montefiorense]